MHDPFFASVSMSRKISLFLLGIILGSTLILGSYSFMAAFTKQAHARTPDHLIQKCDLSGARMVELSSDFFHEFRESDPEMISGFAPGKVYRAYAKVVRPSLGFPGRDRSTGVGIQSEPEEVYYVLRDGKGRFREIPSGWLSHSSQEQLERAGCVEEEESSED